MHPNVKKLNRKYFGVFKKLLILERVNHMKIIIPYHFIRLDNPIVLQNNQDKRLIMAFAWRSTLHMYTTKALIYYSTTDARIKLIGDTKST